MKRMKFPAGRRTMKGASDLSSKDDAQCDFLDKGTTRWSPEEFRMLEPLLAVGTDRRCNQ